MSTVPGRKWRQPPTVFGTAPYARSVPTATTGFVPIATIRRGVISEPPPMPVSPTSMPPPNPNRTISGSKGPQRLVQPALRLVGIGPAALASRVRRQRAVRAADRRVAAVVQLVVRDLVTRDVLPHVALRPVGQRVRLPQPVAQVPVDLLGAPARGRLLAPQARDPAVDVGQRALQRRDLADAAALVGLTRPQRLAVRRRLLLQGDAAEHVDRDVVLRLERAPRVVRLLEQQIGVEREEAR